MNLITIIVGFTLGGIIPTLVLRYAQARSRYRLDVPGDLW